MLESSDLCEWSQRTDEHEAKFHLSPLHPQTPHILSESPGAVPPPPQEMISLAVGIN